MASRSLYFLISNCPRPFHLVAAWTHTLEKHGYRQIFDFTLNPVEAGTELLGHDKKFKIPLEVALMGATTKFGHSSNEPRNVRLLGRFLIQGDLQYESWGTVLVPATAASVLNAWQWEIVFTPEAQAHSNIGFVTVLSEPLPKDWTM